MKFACRSFDGLAALPLTVVAQGTLTGLGSPDTHASGMSADGSLVVGVLSNFGPAFRWSGGRVENIGGTGFQAKISRDGKTIVSDAKDSRDITPSIYLGSGAREDDEAQQLPG
jgi:hypothetical protein